MVHRCPPPSPRAAPESQRVVRNARATAPGAQWLCASAVSQTTARGFEPLRAEPNGFRVHHLNHSVTLSYRVSWHTLQTSKIASHLCCYQLTTNKTSLLSTLQGLLGSAAEEQCCQSFAMSEGHFWEVKLDIVFVCHAFKNHVQLGTWCSGITPAQHAGGPGLNPQCVHLLHGTTLWRRQNKPHTKHGTILQLLLVLLPVPLPVLLLVLLPVLLLVLLLVCCLCCCLCC